jgi:molybdopterin-dependent oxidoreductase alpha subunit
MIKEADDTHYRPISWDDAYALCGNTLRDIESPHRAAFYTSGRASNEAAFLYQLLARTLGTNNLPDCSNMCHESSGTGLGEVIGIGKGTVTLEDFDHSDLIFVIGQNPGTNHPRMLTALQAAARRGANIVSINPLREAALERFKHPQEVTRLFGKGTPIATDFLQVKVGGDVALLQGIAKAVVALDDANPGAVLDNAFIEEHTVGFSTYADSLRAKEWEPLIAQSGISQREMEAIASQYAQAKSVIICWAMGLTQHRHGVANVQECVNLLLLRGNIGRAGAGACPVRGHSNVQGDRTMGIWDRPSPAFLDRLDNALGIKSPREHGYNVVETIAAMEQGAIDVFVALGGNLVSAAPDCDRVGESLKKCRLTVHISTKLNRSHTYPGQTSLILPCLGRTEVDTQTTGKQFITVENSMGVVHRSQGKAAPASNELRSEPSIVAHIAAAAFGESHPVEWLHLVEDYKHIRDLIAEAIAGFEDFNARVKEPNGFVLHNGARERTFRTRSGRAHFTVHDLPNVSVAADELILMTVRSHDQYNTTIYGLDDRYRGVHGQRRVVFLHPGDMEHRGLEAGQPVRITSEYEGVQREVRNFYAVPYDMPQGTAAAYFPEANPLIALESVADRSHTPTSKFVPIRIFQEE